jgi:putative endonuclease
MADRRHIRGRRGEEVARDHLLRAGYTLLAQNWRCALGELDLVMRQGETVVVVEVRTRSAGADAAFESISPAKRTKLVRALHAFLSEGGLDDAPCRVDVIAVRFDATGEHGRLVHAQDVLGWD